jgi:hypothetical protein
MDMYSRSGVLVIFVPFVPTVGGGVTLAHEAAFTRASIARRRLRQPVEELETFALHLDAADVIVQSPPTAFSRTADRPPIPCPSWSSAASAAEC